MSLRATEPSDAVVAQSSIAASVTGAPAVSRPSGAVVEGLDASITIVVPTYKERENLPHLIEKLGQMREISGLDIDLLIMDDNSRDGSAEFVESLRLPWATLITRTTDRGLSPSVVDGLRRARGEVLVVMDADLSHPPEKVPELVKAVARGGADFVIGSRYVAGASTDENWGLFRWLNSKVATLIARPLTTAKDPMAGFFALRRETLARAPYLNPVGYKIALELLVKCDCRKVAEVPIHFADRQFGESKLSFKEQMKYLQHVRRLMMHKYPNWSYVLQFAVVGASGLVVNLIALTACLAAGMDFAWASAAGVAISIVTNFFLNRRFTFHHAARGPIVKQFAGFVASCMVGAVVNYLVANMANRSFAEVWPPQVSAAIGVLAGMAFNFVLNRYFVFKRSPESDLPS